MEIRYAFWVVIMILVTAHGGLHGQITLATQAEVDAWDQSITVLTEDVRIRGGGITNIDALSNLIEIRSHLEIIENRRLTNIDGLSGLTTISGTVEIDENDVLTNVDGLSNLNALNGTLIVGDFFGNEALLNVDGLSGLTSLAGTLKIGGNRILTNIDGLSALTSIAGTLEIDNNDNLINIDGLSNLNSISGGLTIGGFGNNRLLDINGLSGLTSLTGGLGIISNISLTNLDGLSGLTSIPGRLTIRGNTNIRSDKLASIDGLSNVTSIQGYLSITGCSVLTNVDGLSNVNSISGTLTIGEQIRNNLALENIDGLSNLRSLTGTLHIEGNENLTDVDALSGLTSIVGVLLLSENHALTNVDGLSNVTSIPSTGILNIGATGSGAALGNDALLNVDGLSALTTVNGELIIRNNDALLNIDGLCGIENSDGRIVIRVNQSLSDCCGARKIAIEHLQNLNVSIQDNSQGCNNKTEILTSNCGLQFDHSFQASCGGGKNGSITINTTNSDLLPLTYFWVDDSGLSGSHTTNETSHTFGNLGPEEYIISVNQPDCKGAGVTVLIQTNPMPELSHTATEENCGLQDGTLTLTPTSGVGPYNIVGPQTWTGIDSEVTLTNITGGNYMFTITDSNGCSIEETVLVPTFSGPAIVADPTPPDCGDLYGEATLTWTGENGPFSLSGELTEQNIFSPHILTTLDEGSYNLIVTDINGCSGEVDLHVSLRPLPQVTYTATCINSEFYEINIETERSTIVSSDLGAQYLGAGRYLIQDVPIDVAATITMSDIQTACISTQTLSLPDCTCASLSVVTTGENCDQQNGSLLLQLSDGDGPYTITESSGQSWPDIDSELSLTDLVAGDYIFTITSSSGCSITEMLTVPTISAPIVAANVIFPDCGDPYGEVRLNWVGGQSPIELTGDFIESDVSAPLLLNMLEERTYNVIVTDDAGCSDQVTFDITLRPEPQVQYTTTCQDTSAYRIDIQTGMFVVESDLGLDVQSVTPESFMISDVPAGQSPTLTVTDPITGCVTILPIDVPDCSCSAQAFAGTNQVISCFQETVVLDASASSQGPQYTYAWFDGSGTLISTDQQYVATSADTYLLEVFDSQFNCTVGQTVTVTDIRNVPSAVITHLDTVLTCINDFIDLSTTAEDNVRYTWFHEDMALTSEGLMAQYTASGQIRLLATDTITGCESTDQLFIEIDTLAPLINLAPPAQLNCDTDEVLIDGTGSDAGNDISLMWLSSDGTVLSETSAVLSTPLAGMYFLQLKDSSNGCKALDSVEVTENFEAPEFSLVEELGLSCTESSVDISPTLISTNDYDFEWTQQQVVLSEQQLLTVSEEGSYILELRDRNSGCRSSDTILVTAPVEIERLIIDVGDPSCHGDANGFINISEVSGGTPGYNYFLDSIAQMEQTISALGDGTYTVMVVDEQGCDYDTLITLTQPEPFLVEAQLEATTVPTGADVQVAILTDLPVDQIKAVIWSPEIPCDNCLEYTFTDVQQALEYTVTIVNENDCAETVAISVRIDDNLPIYLPTIFSLQEEGNNSFYPQSRETDLMILDMSIYDRWGNLVFYRENFSINDPTQGWDGSFGSEPSLVGVYVYKMQFLLEGEIQNRAGSVTLVR